MAYGGSDPVLNLAVSEAEACDVHMGVRWDRLGMEVLLRHLRYSQKVELLLTQVHCMVAPEYQYAVGDERSQEMLELRTYNGSICGCQFCVLQKTVVGRSYGWFRAYWWSAQREFA